MGGGVCCCSFGYSAVYPWGGGSELVDLADRSTYQAGVQGKIRWVGGFGIFRGRDIWMVRWGLAMNRPARLRGYIIKRSWERWILDTAEKGWEMDRRDVCLPQPHELWCSSPRCRYFCGQLDLGDLQHVMKGGEAGRYRDGVTTIRHIICGWLFDPTQQEELDAALWCGVESGTEELVACFQQHAAVS